MTAAIPLDRQIACARRELKMRERVYPRWVDAGKMTQRAAEVEIEAMRAIIETLEQAHAKAAPELF